MNSKALIRSCIGFGALVASSLPANALFVINLDTRINGDLPPGVPPLASATFKTVGIDQVELTMANHMTNIGTGETFIASWVFNMVAIPGNLSFTFLSGVEAEPSYPVWGSNAYTGGSSVKGGLFDVWFNFPPPPGGPANTFGGGEVSKWLITGTGLTEMSFAATSVPDPEKGSWASAAKVQGFWGKSGSIGGREGFVPPAGNIPEPFTMALMGGAAIVGFRRIRSRRK